MSDDFTTPDWNAPLDVRERIARAPASAHVKGMYLQSVAESARAASGKLPGRGRWVVFKDYPMTEWITLLAEAAPLAHPRLSTREGLRRLGQRAYPTFAESTIGKVVMSVAGDNFLGALKVSPRAFSVSGTTRVEIIEAREGYAVLGLRGAWDFPDAWGVGVFEGAMQAFGKRGAVRVRALSLSDVDLELTW